MTSLRKNLFFLLVAAFLILAVSEKTSGQTPPKTSAIEAAKGKVIARQELEVTAQIAPLWYVQGKFADPQHPQEGANFTYLFRCLGRSHYSDAMAVHLEVVVERQYSGDPKPLLAEALKTLEKRLNASYLSEKPRLGREIEKMKSDLLEMHKRESLMMGQLLEIQNNLPEPFTPKGFDEQLDRLKQQQFVLQVEIAGLKARWEAILRKMKEAPIESDTLPVKYAEANFKVLQAELANIIEANKKMPGGIPQKDLDRAKWSVTKAMLELEASKIPANRESLRQLLQQTELELATAEARHKVINQTLGKIPAEKIVEYQKISREINLCQKSQELLQKSLFDRQSEFGKLYPVEIREISPPQYAPEGGELPNYYNRPIF